MQKNCNHTLCYTYPGILPDYLEREEKKSPRMEPVKTVVEQRLRSPVKPPVRSAEKSAEKKPVKQKRPIQKPPGIPAMSFDWIRF